MLSSRGDLSRVSSTLGSGLPGLDLLAQARGEGAAEICWPHLRPPYLLLEK